MAVVKNLMVRAGGDFGALKKSMEKAKKDIDNFKQSATNSMKALKAALAALAIGKIIKDSVKSAMEVESAVNQIKRIMGESSDAFLKWAKTQSIAFNMSKTEAMKYGSVFGNLISGFTSGTGETMKYTEELLKSAAVVASATGRTMEDTLDRIRSGLLGNTESIEDLGINVNVAMIESTDAFKKFANGKSWQQLDYKVQSQIRLFAILEQSSKKYGDTLANTTASQQQKFIATMNNVKLNIGNAFLPIYQVVLPALSSLATKLEYVTNIISQFMQALFGKVQATGVSATESQTAAVDALADSYDAAGSAAKGSLAGFDEVNSLSSGSGAAGSGVSSAADSSGSGSYEPTIPDISAKVQAMADKVKTAFREMAAVVSENKALIISALAGIGAAFATSTIIANWGAIVTALKTAGKVIGTALAGISLPITLIVAAIGAAVAAFVYFYQTNEGFRNTVKDILNGIKDAAINLWQNVLIPLGSFLADVFVRAWNGVSNAANWLWKNVLVPIGNFLIWFNQNVVSPLSAVLSDVLGVAFMTVSNIAKSFWINVMVPLGAFLKDTFKPAAEALSAVFNYFWINVLSPFGTFLSTTFKPILQSIVEKIQFMWYNVLKPLATFVGGIFTTVFDTAFKAVGRVIEDVKLAFIGLMTFITGVFTGDWEKAWNGVKDIFSGIFSALHEYLIYPLNLIISAINKVISGLNSISIKVPDWVPEVGGKTWGVSIPKIPMLAKGGITDGPMTAIIGDNPGGKEAVAPLSDLMDMIASAVGTAMLSVTQATENKSTSGDLVMNIEGKTFARIMNPFITSEQQRLGSRIIVQST